MSQTDNTQSTDALSFEEAVLVPGGAPVQAVPVEVAPTKENQCLNAVEEAIPAEKKEGEKSVEFVPYIPGGADVSATEEKKLEQECNISSEDVKNLMFQTTLVHEHVDLIRKAPHVYERQVQIMISRKLHTEFTPSLKARILAAAVIGKRREFVEYLLRVPSMYTITEVLKAVLILDAPRQRRQLAKKMQQLRKQMEEKPGSVRPIKVSRLQTDIHNLESETVEGASLSGALSKKIRRWIGTISAENLEFYLLNFPKDSWVQLLNLIHSNPKDFQLPYFQNVVFGGEAPKESIITLAQTVTKENIQELLEAEPKLCGFYSYLRRILNAQTPQQKKVEAVVSGLMKMGFTERQARVSVQFNIHTVERSNTNVSIQHATEWIFENHVTSVTTEPVYPAPALNNTTKAILARHGRLEDILWYYEELDCSEVENILDERLGNGEEIVSIGSRTNYGKLMERLLLFKEKNLKFVDKLVPYAQAELKKIRVPRTEDMNIAVLGDASGSMEVAIKTASIVGSLLSVVFHADLSFFDEVMYKPSCNPKDVQDTICVVEETQARGATSMASALWPYYENHKVMDLFILVSDEQENTSFHGSMFAELFKKYKAEVSPDCKLFLVSFLDVGDNGLLKQSLEAEGIECQQFRLALERPDTSKFDALLGRITLETTAARAKWNAVEDALFEAQVPTDVVGVIKGFCKE